MFLEEILTSSTKINNLRLMTLHKKRSFPLRISPVNVTKSAVSDYFTKNSMCNFKEPRFSLKVTKFAISSRGPSLWNKILDNNTKAFTSYSLFQTTMKID